MKERMKNRIIRLLCNHESADDKGVIELWNGERRMVRQCSCCNALFVNGYNISETLPDMLTNLKKEN